MATKVVTFYKPDTSLEGRLLSQHTVVVWNSDLSDPKFDKITLPHRVPTILSADLSPELLKKIVERYKQELKDEYLGEYSKVASELARKTAPSAKTRLASKRDVLTKFLSAIEQITLEGPFGKGRYRVYHVVTPPTTREKRAKLSRPFIDEDVANLARMQLNYPFCIVEEKDGQLVPTGTRLCLEALVHGKAIAKDFETQNWQKRRAEGELFHCSEEELRGKFLELIEAYHEGFCEDRLKWMDRKDFIRGIEDILNKHKDERITVSSIINLRNNENYLITTLDCGTDIIDVQIPGTQQTVPVKIIKVKDQHELIREDNRLSAEINALFIYGHNHMRFDYLKAKELTKDFRPGVGGTEPLQLSQCPGGFIRQVVAPGRLDIDGSCYAQNWLYTHNNRLDTVFFHCTRHSSKKTVPDYDTLTAITRRAEAGSKKDAHDILYYAAQDAMKSSLIGEAILEEHLLLCKVFNSNPSRIDSVAKKSLAIDYWTCEYYRRKHTHPTINIGRQGKDKIRFENFSGLKAFNNVIKDGKKSVKGVHNCYLLAFFPYSAAFKEMLSRDPNIRGLYTMAKESGMRRKTVCLKALEAIAEYPFFKSIVAPENAFAAEFELGWEGSALNEYKNRVLRIFERIEQFLTASPLININKELLLVSASTPEKELERICEDNLAVLIGEGRFLSGTAGRFAGNIDGELWMQGIADFQSNKGERCQFEKSFYQTFITKVLKGDLRSALGYLAERAKLLADGKLVREEVEYAREAKKELIDYSVRAMQPHIRFMAEQETRKGDMLRYEYSKTQMQKKFFGIEEGPTSKKDFEEQQEQGVKKRKKIAAGRRPMRLFEEPNIGTGTISEIVGWVFDFAKRESLPALYEIYRGKGGAQHIDRLMSLYESRVCK